MADLAVLIRQLQGMLGGAQIRFGNAGGVAAGGSVVVNHGLSKTPVAILLDSNANTSLWYSGVGATQFTINNLATGNATSSTSWVAIA